MAAAFVVDWNVPDIQNRVSSIEAMGMDVGGAEAVSPEHAIEGIRDTAPDMVVLWANDHLERTKQVLLDLRWAVQDIPPFIYVDADAEAEDELEQLLPGTFVPSAGLEEALKHASRQTAKR